MFFLACLKLTYNLFTIRFSLKYVKMGNLTGNKPYLECGCLVDQQGPAHI